ncbi:uncharacterized protein ATNIH1004_000181 [Aspergillus tanneri]|uniref:Rhodopsin domain-containing protein n=1 Tax=Aspergillus tanneri TaxID=1220188 RepID=A0A5M9N104_9EURO|nr:uncharacterized protein ATNIH1004_000181 [Aspergillus tanneri]KAA8651300.1 hypothetical protein ATNIH1004_000181 [Aspergillus tanneri]
MSTAVTAPIAPYMYGLNKVGYATLVVSIFFMALSVASVALRLWTRRIKNNKLGIDDWLIIASVFVFFGFCADVLVGVYTYGGGQSEYAIPALYAVNVTLVKMSILFFYRRVFAVAGFRRINTFVMAFCMVWFVAAVIGDLLYCIPIQRFWDPSAGGSCFNFAAYFLAMELVDMLLDVVIIALPVNTILGLHLSLRKRLALLGIFLLSAFVVITGAVRIGYVYKPGDQLLSLAQASLWSVINLGVAILCASLPTYRPLLPKFESFGSMFRTRYIGWSRADSRTSKSDGSTCNTYNPRSGYYSKMEGGTGAVVPLTIIAAEESHNAKRDRLPTGGIQVQRDVEVV